MRITMLVFWLSLLVLGCEPTSACEQLNGSYEVECDIVGVYDSGTIEISTEQRIFTVVSGHTAFVHRDCDIPLVMFGADFVGLESETCGSAEAGYSDIQSVTGTLSCDGAIAFEIESEDSDMVYDPPRRVHVSRTWMCHGAKL